MASAIGVCLGKINGTFDVWIKGMKWRISKPVPQHTTGGGIVSALGIRVASGSIDEVIPTTGTVPWLTLVDFTLQIYDQPTQKIQLAAFEQLNWESIDGSCDLASAMTLKSISWKANLIVSML